MNKVILIRHGEIHLKGKNKRHFENLLIAAVKRQLDGIECTFTHNRNRYIVSDYAEHDESVIAERLRKVFGIHSFSIASVVKNSMDEIAEEVIAQCVDNGSFRISTNRADKHFPLNSMEVNRKIGGAVLSAKPELRVDLNHADFTVNIDIREEGDAFIYTETILGAGGMPTGSSGKGLLLLSGGIDSPVAGYLMGKRGMSFSAIHFHSYPYTSEMAKQKVIDLAKIVAGYTGSFTLYCLPFAKIQEEIHRCCDDTYMITLLRCCMMESAEILAKRIGAGALINGESLGQVASQTLESITVTQSRIKNLPVFRPLIGNDKSEIIEIARKIGTYETSILPYEDCCTVFLPERPVIKPTIERMLHERAKIANLDDMILAALNDAETIKIV